MNAEKGIADAESVVSFGKLAGFVMRVGTAEDAGMVATAGAAPARSVQPELQAKGRNLS
jgi:hypothetical protein